jgi:hypothetical protein
MITTLAKFFPCNISLNLSQLKDTGTETHRVTFEPEILGKIITQNDLSVLFFYLLSDIYI